MIANSSTPEDNTAISRDTKLALVMQRLKNDEVQDLEKKEYMIMRDGDFATMIQQKEDE